MWVFVYRVYSLTIIPMNVFFIPFRTPFTYIPCRSSRINDNILDHCAKMPRWSSDVAPSQRRRMCLPFTPRSLAMSHHYRARPWSQTVASALSWCEHLCPSCTISIPIWLGSKGLERQRLIGLTEAGFYHVWKTTKAFAPSVDPRGDAYVKGICSPGS